MRENPAHAKSSKVATDRTTGALPVHRDLRNVDAEIRQVDADSAEVLSGVPDLPVGVRNVTGQLGNLLVDQ